MAKNFLKFAWGFGALLILGLAIFYGIQYYQYRQNPQFQAQKQFEELERLYQEDTYGGFTHEETLQLFIEALKTGDVELASKYFIIEDQQEELEKLQKIKDRELLDKFLVDINKLGNKYSLVEGDDDRFIFEAFNERGELILQADVGKGPNGRWKIIDL